MRMWILVVLLLIPVNALAISPEEIREAYQKSYNYEKLDDYDNAIKTLSGVLEAYPDGYTVNLRLGWLYYLDEKYANSIDHYLSARKAIPTSIEAKLGYILPLLDQGKYKEVETLAEEIISVDYYNYYANMRLAYVLRLQKKFDLAEKVVNKMLAVYPIDVSFLTELGLIHDGRGEVDLAAKAFWDVLVLDPENTTAKNYLNLADDDKE